MATNRAVFPHFFPLRPRIEGAGVAFDARLLGLVIAGMIVFSLASILYLSQASYVTSTSYRIQELEKELQVLQRIKARRMQELTEATAPARLEARAIALGFGPPRRTVYVDLGAGLGAGGTPGTRDGSVGSSETGRSVDIWTRLRTWLSAASPIEPEAADRP